MKFAKILSAGILAISLGAFAGTAQATLIANPGYVSDTATGLDWLLMNATQGQSYNAIIGGYGGYIADGWQYATTADVIQLFDDAGGTGGPYTNPYPSAAYGAVASLLGNLLGWSYGTVWTVGITAATTGAGFHELVVWQANGDGTGFLIASNWVSWPDTDTSYYGYGSSLLVRNSDTVPAPGALALLGLGLLGLGALRRNVTLA